MVRMTQDLPASKPMGIWEEIKVSTVLCSPWKGKHQVTTTKWSLGSTVHMVTRMTTTGWVFQGTPVDSWSDNGKTESLTRLISVLLFQQMVTHWDAKAVSFSLSTLLPSMKSSGTTCLRSSKRGKFVRNLTMNIPQIILNFLLSYLVIFKIIQPIKLVSVPVSVKIRQLQ